MDALWASPSIRSPTSSSSGSPSEAGSPQLPALSSPFNMSLVSPPWDEPAPDTPTKAVAHEPPGWMTAELDEEWIEPDATSADDQQQADRSPPPGPPESTYASLNRPRVPSSLRYAFTSSAATTAASQRPVAAPSPERARSPSTSTWSSAGTFVVRDSSSSSIKVNDRPADGADSQLQAAVRALQGPSAGLGAQPSDVEAGEHPVPGNKARLAPGSDRLGGLRRLFDPPSPPTPLPPSSAPAPSIKSFDFSPPLVPRTSWKSLAHFSPTDSATPLARTADAETDADETPTRKPLSSAPALKAKDRYLRSVALTTSQSAPAPAPSTPVRDASEPAAETPASQLRLFEFQYDTFTRDHLLALVDEIDELGSAEHSLAARQADDHAWETSFVEAPTDKGKGKEEDQEEDELADSMGRSSKRIRLSPPDRRRRSGPAPRTESRSRSSTSTSRRRAARHSTAIDVWALAASQPSPTRSADTPPLCAPNPFAQSLFESAKKVTSAESAPLSTRDRLGAANALLDRIRARTSKAPIVPDDEVPAEPEPDHEPARRSVLSPRKLLRRISASDEVDAELGSSLLRSNATAPTGELPHLAAAASASVRSALGQSSFSPASASIVGVGSRPSVDTPPSCRRHFARTPVSVIGRRGHARSSSKLDPFSVSGGLGVDESLSGGRQHSRHQSLTTIGPGDVEALLAAAATPSRMVFNRIEGRWVKTAKSGPALARIGEPDESASTDDDPFRDFETTRHSDQGGLSGLGIFTGNTPPAGTTRRAADSPADANHFAPPAPVNDPETEDDDAWPPGIPDLTGDLEHETEDQTDEHAPGAGGGDDSPTEAFDREESPFHLFHALQGATAALSEPSDAADTQNEVDATVLPADIAEPLVISITTLAPTSPLSSTPVPASIPFTPQPILTPSTRPRSALKSAARTQSDPGFLTPDARAAALEARVQRSVSFSDGKTSGKIEGLVPAEPPGSRLKFELAASVSDDDPTANSGMGPMGEAGSLEMEECETPVIGSPASLAPSTRSRGIDRALRELEANNTSPDHSVVISTFDSAPKVRAKSRSPSHSRTFRRTTAADATFLTECSFGVSRDRLIKLITDVEPFEPDWEGLRSIDLASKGAESLARLKDFLPNLDEVDLSENEIAYLTGVPSTVRTLLIPHNRLSSLTSFGHLRNLERIDMSNNHVDSVYQLACLVHLRELKADNNQIRDLAGLADIDGLVRLSLKGNQIESIDFAATSWARLETLNLSRNRISTILNVDRLQSLSQLNLDYNKLTHLDPPRSMPRLRILRLCSNQLDALDISFSPKLRTLFVDSARLGRIAGADRLRKLENLSVRDQSGSTLTLPMHEVRDVKRLYLSGNPLPPSFPSAQFFNLVYLELAMCGLLSLPSDLAALVPNVRVLNLNFNFLDDLAPLTGLSRLRKLTALGARLSKCRPVVEVLRTMDELESVDLRMNPLTLAFYAPHVLQQGADLPPHEEYRILHPEDDDGGVPRSRQWAAIDSKFKRALPDLYNLRRKAYRAVILKSCPALVELDGIECSRERRRLIRAGEQ